MKAWNHLRPVRLSSLFGAFASLLAAASPVAASTFNIAPIRANLSGAHHTEVLTLANVEDDPVVVQVRVVRWSQADGEEQLDDTRDLLATPPVLQIGPKSEQIVRVALRQQPDPARELSYRIVFQEVPQTASTQFMGLRVALRLSVPVFIAPAGGKAIADVGWEARWLPDGKLELAATNRGNAHLQVTDFEVLLADAGGKIRGVTAKYVLPGSRMTWLLTPLPGGNHQGPIRIHGRSDQGDFSADVVTDTP